MSANEWNAPIVEEFRANNGKVGGMFEHLDLVLLRNKGAKSGTERINPVAYLPVDGGNVAVFASAGGAPGHPDWYYNVVANPDVVVETGDETYNAKARIAKEQEREQTWEAVKKKWPQFAEYEEKTKGIREIPVVILERT